MICARSLNWFAGKYDLKRATKFYIFCFQLRKCHLLIDLFIYLFMSSFILHSYIEEPFASNVQNILVVAERIQKACELAFAFN